MKTIIVYDDTGYKSESIRDIIGDRGFADVVVKRRFLADYFNDEMSRLFGNTVFKKMSSVFEYAQHTKAMEIYADVNVRILHFFSNYMISDMAKASLGFRKLEFVDEPIAVLDGSKAVAVMFSDVNSYMAFCKNVMAGQSSAEVARNMKSHFQIEGMTDIGEVDNFIQCITGNFDSRYFNSLEGGEFTIVKSSSNKDKIKAEYTFYHLLPEDMKRWFVLPYNYEENGEKAQYTMERLHMTDIAIKWVHGSIDEREFEELMERYFRFFADRHPKQCDAATYKRISDELYVKKVNDRIAKLKEHDGYGKIATLLSGYEGLSIDDLVNKYFELKKKIESENDYPSTLAVGHGDPCFANALYNRATKILKFIDPKGAMTEEDLWTNPYYDIAKLSHSVCGRYDFFNNGLFDIKISPDFEYNLEMSFDNLAYKEIFKKFVQDNGYDYLTVRIYEASLFLSMLPLHMDNPHKVFGFILNIRDILKEIEENV